MVSTDVGDVRHIFGDVPGYFLCSDDPKAVASTIERALDVWDRTTGRERIMELGLSLEQEARQYLEVYGKVLNHSS